MPKLIVPFSKEFTEGALFGLVNPVGIGMAVSKKGADVLEQFLKRVGEGEFKQEFVVFPQGVLRDFVFEGLHKKYPDIAKLVNRWIFKADRRVLKKLVSHDDYPQYADDVKRVLKSFYHRGEIPVRRVIGYHHPTKPVDPLVFLTREKPAPVATSLYKLHGDFGFLKASYKNPKLRPVLSGVVNIDDVVALGSPVEAELIVPINKIKNAVLEYPPVVEGAKPKRIKLPGFKVE